MIVACPHCKTTYNLPDDKAKPSVKLRCTVCKQVFSLAESHAAAEQAASSAAGGNADEALGDLLEKSRPSLGDGELSINIPESKGKKQSRLPVVLALLLVVLCIGIGITWNKTRLLDPVKTMLGLELPPTQEEIEARHLLKREEMVGKIGMKDMRQYYMVNEKVGKILVFEGKAVNEFDEPRELIRVEVDLLDENDTLLVRKSQLAGAEVSFFQLQVLDQGELEQNLNNKLDIVSRNTNVPPGGAVPFMMVFYNPPEDAVVFDVKILDARRPESPGDSAN